MSRLVRNWRWVLRDMAHAARVRVDATVRAGRHDARAFLEPADGARAQTVVAIPGVYESWHFMLPVARALAAAGHPVHLLAELGVNRRPIPETAARVADYLAQHDLTDVLLVGHSKGGLIGKHVMALDDPDDRVDRLIAIASPFSGSRYARWMLQPALRTFRPTAPVVAALGALTAVDARITSVYPEFDPHVPEGSVVPGAVNVEVPVRGHFRVLVDDVAVATIVRLAAARSRGEQEPSRGA